MRWLQGIQASLFEHGWGRLCHPARQRRATPGTPNFAALDMFSIIHGLGGAACGLLGLGLGPTAALAIAWEFIEHVMKNACPAAFINPSQDTLVNSIGDVACALIGWFAGYYVRRYAAAHAA